MYFVHIYYYYYFVHIYFFIQIGLLPTFYHFLGTFTDLTRNNTGRLRSIGFRSIGIFISNNVFASGYSFCYKTARPFKKPITSVFFVHSGYPSKYAQ